MSWGPLVRSMRPDTEASLCLLGIHTCPGAGQCWELVLEVWGKKERQRLGMDETRRAHGNSIQSSQLSRGKEQDCGFQTCDHKSNSLQNSAIKSREAEQNFVNIQ